MLFLFIVLLLLCAYVNRPVMPVSSTEWVITTVEVEESADVLDTASMVDYVRDLKDQLFGDKLSFVTGNFGYGYASFIVAVNMHEMQFVVNLDVVSITSKQLYQVYVYHEYGHYMDERTKQHAALQREYQILIAGHEISLADAMQEEAEYKRLMKERVGPDMMRRLLRSMVMCEISASLVGRQYVPVELLDLYDEYMSRNTKAYRNVRRMALQELRD